MPLSVYTNSYALAALLESTKVRRKVPALVFLIVATESATDDVCANTTLVAFVAQLAVPINAPVSEPVNEAVTELKTASDPDTMTFFQFGIVIS